MELDRNTDINRKYAIIRKLQTLLGKNISEDTAFAMVRQMNEVIQLHHEKKIAMLIQSTIAMRRDNRRAIEESLPSGMRLDSNGMKAKVQAQAVEKA